MVWCVIIIGGLGLGWCIGTVIAKIYNQSIKMLNRYRVEYDSRGVPLNLDLPEQIVENLLDLQRQGLEISWEQWWSYRDEYWANGTIWLPSLPFVKSNVKLNKDGTGFMDLKNRPIQVYSDHGYWYYFDIDTGTKTFCVFG